MNWSGFLHKIPDNFDELIITMRSGGLDKKRTKLLGNLAYTMIWWLWKERNERMFGNRRRNPMQLADEIQLNAFNWVKNRGKVNQLKWAEWSVKPGTIAVCLTFCHRSDVSAFRCWSWSLADDWRWLAQPLWSLAWEGELPMCLDNFAPHTEFLLLWRC
ncbi:hypothetical protein LXL04_014790 [Taraxacum kok-saghyz]